MLQRKYWSEAVSPKVVHSVHKGLKRGRGNKSSNISKGCMERDGGAQEQEGKGGDVKRLKEMKRTI